MAHRASGRAPPSRALRPGAAGPWTLFIVLAAVALLAAGILVGWKFYSPLDIEAPPGVFTRLKLARLDGNPAACFAALQTSSLKYSRVPDQPLKNGCGVRAAVRVERSEARLSSSFMATCALAASWAMFDLHALQPAARRHYGTKVARVIHKGTYACRNVRGRKVRRRSQHARANAIDISAFVLADGARISVLDGWKKDGAAKAFLQDVHAGACRFFTAALGPDFNAAHRDHFHFDRGRITACR